MSSAASAAAAGLKPFMQCWERSVYIELLMALATAQSGKEALCTLLLKES
jgi:hypothetical protein